MYKRSFCTSFFLAQLLLVIFSLSLFTIGFSSIKAEEKNKTAVQKLETSNSVTSEPNLDCSDPANSQTTGCKANFSIFRKVQENILQEQIKTSETDLGKTTLFEQILSEPPKDNVKFDPQQILNKVEDFKNVDIDQFVKNQLQSALNKQFLEKAKTEYINILNQKGKVNLDFTFTKEFQLATYKLLYMLPIYDSHKYLVFNQLGYNFALNEENFLNIGVAFRSFYTNVLGANLFLDYDLTSGHSRASFGIEAATDLFRLSSNYYMPISSWKPTGLYDRGGYEFLSRPSHGFDFSLEGFLPYERTLSGEISLTRWFGATPIHWNNASIAEVESLKKNASILNASLSWKPIPLIGASIGYTHSLTSTTPQISAKLNLNWNLDEPFVHAFSRGASLQNGTFFGMHREFVKRHDYMVMEYKVEPPYIAKNIDIKPNVAKRNGYFDSTLRTVVTLEIIPITERRRIIPNIADVLTITPVINKNIVSFTKITETDSPGVYKTTYTGKEIGFDEIEVSYYDKTARIPIRIQDMTRTFDAFPITPKDYSRKLRIPR